MLEQAQVLGAAPPALRPYVEGSYYGESGVDVELTSGIELRFGDASQAARKWRAAAAVLADPSITALDYVDLHAPEPARPTAAAKARAACRQSNPASGARMRPRMRQTLDHRVRVGETLKSVVENLALQDACPAV